MRIGWILAAAALAVAGCSSDTSDGNGSGGAGGSAGAAGSGGTGGTGGTAGAGGTGGDGGTGGEIVVPTDEFDVGWTPEAPMDALDGPMNEIDRPGSCPPERGFFSSIRGWVSAPGGKPLAGAKAQLCVYYGVDGYSCLSPVTTDDEGVYTIDVLPAMQCFREAAMRVVRYDSNRAALYCPISIGEGPAVRRYDPTVLPFALPAIDLPPVGDPDAPRDVTFDDGLVMVATPSRFEPVEDWRTSYRNFSGRRVDVEAVGLCGDAATFDGLYAFYPEGKIDGTGYPLRIPNKNGYAAGTKVELFVLGGLDCELNGKKVPEAEWAKFGEGTVSDDEAIIASDEGAGLPCTTWMSYRAKE